MNDNTDGAPTLTALDTEPVSFTLTDADIRAMERRLGVPKTVAWILVGGTAIAVGSVVLTVAPLLRRHPEHLATVCKAAALRVLLPVFALLALQWVWRAVRARRSGRTDSDRPMRRASLTAEHLVQQVGEMEARTAWSEIQAIDADNRYLYLLLTKQSGFLIPRRAFSGGDAAERFLTEAIRCWQIARMRTETEPTIRQEPPPGCLIAIAYTWTTADLQAWDRRTAPPLRRWIIPVVLLAPLVGVASGLRYDVPRLAGHPERWLKTGEQALGAVVIPIGIVLAFFLLRRHLWANAARETATAMRGRYTAVTETGLIDRDGTGESTIAWSALHRLEQDSAYIYVWTTKTVGFPIPKRAFVTPGEAERFYETARRLWKNEAPPATSANPW